MVVDVLDRDAAQPVLGLAVAAVHHVGEVVLGQQVQVPVDGGQPDLVAAVAQFVVQLLGGAEAVRLAQQPLDGGGLLGLPHPAGQRHPADLLRAY